MLKRTKSFVGFFITIFITLSIVPATVFAATAGDTFNAGYFKYTVNADTTTVTLTSIVDTTITGAVTVPSQVSDGNTTYTVTQLSTAFDTRSNASAKNITSIVLPDTITKFTTSATFYGCTGLTSIKLPANLSAAPETGQMSGTFKVCTKLTSVELPAAIIKCWGTFQESGVKTVTITGTKQVDFYAGSGTEGARAWKNGTTGVTVWYPANGTAPYRANVANAVSATIKKYIISDGFRYNVNTDNATVTLAAIADTTIAGAVTIPSQVSDGNTTYTVTQLATAFDTRSNASAKNITSIVLPDTITKFTTTGTFYGCKFTSIHLPANLTAAPDAGQLSGTFKDCTKLASVDIPAGITKCWATFQGSGVRTVTITGTSQVDFYAGSGTTAARAWLDGTTGITIYYPYNGTAPKRTSASGSFTATVKVIMPTFTEGNFNYEMNEDGASVTLTSVAAQELSGDVVVPASVTYDGKEYAVTTIGYQAFNAKKAITSLTIPATVTTIGYQAFMEMDGLTSFVMPDSVETIGYGLFYGCSNLEEVKLSKNLKGEMTTTFAYCAKLNNCIIPDGVTALNRTFMYCNIINFVVVPESVTTITDNTTDKLFTVFNTDEELTGAPTEPGFVVMGKAGSKIETYMATNGWNFRAIDFDMPLALQAPKPHEDKTVTVNVANFNKTDKAADMSIYCAYYSKEDGQLIDVGFMPLDVANALDVEDVIITMNEDYDAKTVYARAFAWVDGTIEPLSETAELYETVVEEN